MTIELVPLAHAVFTLAPPILILNGPRGTRGIVEVTDARFEGERLNARLKGSAAADWSYVSPDGTIVTLDVRVTLETDDGALIFTEYSGRLDVSRGFGTAPVYAAPRYETGDDRYRWLNLVQGVAKGEMRPDLTEIRYDIYEAR